MTIAQLIEKLKQFNPETLIIVAGYEEGFNDIDSIDEVSIDVDSDKRWYCGRHKQNETGNGIAAVVLTGSNLIAED